MTVAACFWCYTEGVSTCNDVEEAGDATEDEEHRVVDEEEAPPSRVPAESAQLRAAALGSHARRKRV